MTDSLPDRMEAAAETLEQASARNQASLWSSWRPTDLRSLASEWRAEDEARQSIETELMSIVSTSMLSPRSAVRAILRHFDVTRKPGNDPGAAMGPGPWESDAGSGAHDYSAGPPR